MNLVAKLLALTIWRRVVQPKSMATMIVFLREDLKDLGFYKQSDFPNGVMHVFTEEAYRRAAEREKDKLARYGRMYREIEIVAREIVAAFQGDDAADPRIKKILEFHHLI